MAKRQAILGRKIGMTQILPRPGEVFPVTVIEGFCYVTQVKTMQSDGIQCHPDRIWPHGVSTKRSVAT